MDHNLKNWLDLAGGQIAWKPGRKTAIKELEAHIMDQKDDFEAQGMDSAQALAASLREMGDPVEIGSELDKLHRPKSCTLALLIMVVLFFLGIMFKMAVVQERASQDMLYSVVGFGFMLLVWRMDYTILFRFDVPVYFTTIKEQNCENDESQATGIKS